MSDDLKQTIIIGGLVLVIIIVAYIGGYTRAVHNYKFIIADCKELPKKYEKLAAEKVKIEHELAQLTAAINVFEEKIIHMVFWAEIFGPGLRTEDMGPIDRISTED